MKKTLLLFGALIWLGSLSEVRAQTHLSEWQAPAPQPTFQGLRIMDRPFARGSNHLTLDHDRRHLQAKTQADLDARYGFPVKVQEAWMFDEDLAMGAVTVCGAVQEPQGDYAIFVMQFGHDWEFADVYADRQQFKTAGCERPGYAVIFPKGSGAP